MSAEITKTVVAKRVYAVDADNYRYVSEQQLSESVRVKVATFTKTETDKGVVQWPTAEYLVFVDGVALAEKLTWRGRSFYARETRHSGMLKACEDLIAQVNADAPRKATPARKAKSA